MSQTSTPIDRAEQALRVAHLESEVFINSVPSILIGTDANGRITRWNLAATGVFGLPASSVLGKTLRECGIKWSSAEDVKEIESWGQIHKGGRPCELRFEKHGTQRFLGLNVTRIVFANQHDCGLLITGADVTERRQLEVQLRQAQKLEAIGQLAAGIAHEINTPTQYVGDNTNYIREVWPAIGEVVRTAKAIDALAHNNSLTPEALNRLHACLQLQDFDSLLAEIPIAIDQSLDGLKRVAGIVRSMKEFSHPGVEEKTPVDINHAIETTIQITRNEWKYVAEVEARFASDLPFVQCHGGEFNQVILNLIVNAAHAIREVVGGASAKKGKISITTRQHGDSVEVAIHDTGCGIPDTIQPRIFEPFFTTKPVGQGTGQGLALAHATIVRRHNGRLWFESVPGQGTTFFIRLPISPHRQT